MRPKFNTGRERERSQKEINTIKNPLSFPLWTVCNLHNKPQQQPRFSPATVAAPKNRKSKHERKVQFAPVKCRRYGARARDAIRLTNKSYEKICFFNGQFNMHNSYCFAIFFSLFASFCKLIFLFFASFSRINCHFFFSVVICIERRWAKESLVSGGEWVRNFSTRYKKKKMDARMPEC